MKTTRLIVGLLAVGLIATACGDNNKAAVATTPGGVTTPGGTTAAPTTDCKPVKAGVLTVVTSLPGPNFWGTTKAEVDPDAIKSGIEYDMGNLIAAKCGLTMKFRNENFDAVVAGQIDPTSYDIVLSQVTITADRAKVVDFSVGYFKSDQGLLVNKGTAVKTWDDVKKLTIGVQASTTAEYDVTSGQVPGWQLSKVKSFPDLASAYAALSAGTVDGIMIDTPINLGQAAQSGGKQEVVAQFKTGEEYGAIYGKANGKKAIFDPIIQGMLDDGTITGLITKYLGGDPATVPFVDVPTA
ncbi:MAG: polar amino acid transport system substrate-binding protein [Ilumatobacteraceae bacterium]|jgi:polar amino acid transport system substrate-binding protein|nr:polar amino acid transport system substrate-binding protein [Ilumatobacteraceae bacterium]